MQLIDFLTHDGLVSLREKMGAQELGHFELFDANKQLTLSEREALASTGMVIPAQELRVLKDKTLAFKNSRTWLSFEQKYHLAYCQQAQLLRHRQVQLRIGTASWDKPKGKDSGVCLECLALLQYQGFDSRRLRRAEYAEQINEGFSLAEFGQQYPFYPIAY